MSKRTGIRISALIGFAPILASGCSTIEATVPDDVLEIRPIDRPARTLTNFSEGLTCLGRRLSNNKVEPVYVAVSNIPDHSESQGAAGYGAKEMIISAVSRLSEETGLVRLVAYDRSTPNVVALHNAHPQKQNLRIPDFFIRGAITQIETSPYSKQHGSSLSLGEDIIKDMISAGGSNSNSVTMKSISLDMNMGMVSTYQILPGVSSTNTMAVAKYGDSTEFTISFDKVGGIYSVNENRADALSAALRSLVEVGVIELFGKLYNANWATCMAQLYQTNPLRKEARENYDGLLEDNRHLPFVREQLQAQGYITNADAALSEGEPNAAFQEAIAAYRVQNDLFPSTKVDFKMYEKLFIQSKASAEHRKSGTGVGPIQRWLHNAGQS